MVSRYLLDASAIYPLMLRLREELLSYVGRLAIIDLTIYEMENAIWKEFREGRIRDPTIVAKLFEEIFNSVPVLRLQIKLREAMELAISRTSRSTTHPICMQHASTE